MRRGICIYLCLTWGSVVFRLVFSRWSCVVGGGRCVFEDELHVLPLRERGLVLRVLREGRTIAIRRLYTALCSDNTAVHQSLRILRGGNVVHHARNNTMRVSDSTGSCPVALQRGRGLSTGSLVTRQTFSRVHSKRALFVSSDDAIYHLTQHLAKFRRLHIVAGKLGATDVLTSVSNVRICSANNHLHSGTVSFANDRTIKFIRRFGTSCTFVSYHNISPSMNVASSSRDRTTLGHDCVRGSEHIILLYSDDGLKRHCFYGVTPLSTI